MKLQNFWRNSSTITFLIFIPKWTITMIAYLKPVEGWRSWLGWTTICQRSHDIPWPTQGKAVYLLCRRKGNSILCVLCYCNQFLCPKVSWIVKSSNHYLYSILNSCPNYCLSPIYQSMGHFILNVNVWGENKHIKI